MYVWDRVGNRGDLAHGAHDSEGRGRDEPAQEKSEIRFKGWGVRVEVLGFIV